MKISIIIGLFVFLASCGPSNPETILGVQLGKPLKEQQAKASSVLIKKTFENKYWNSSDVFEYTTIGDKDHYFESYIDLSSCNDNNGQEIVTGVTSVIINPSVIHFLDTNPRIKISPVLLHTNESDGLWLIKLFQEKYGNTDVKSINSGFSLKWEKKDLDIKLDIRFQYDGFNKGDYYKAIATYEYPEKIKNIVCKQTKTIKY